MIDVLVVGAGPAGSIAALALARAGARVQIVDRASFPRDKMCGDTVNPGALACLRRLGVAEAIEARGLRVNGMRLTGENGAAVEGRYPDAVNGVALLRRDLDWALLRRATDAGAAFEPGIAVRAPLVDTAGAHPIVRGALVGGSRSATEIRARVTVAADGRRSTLAFALGLARHPGRPRRWAIGGYFADVPSSGASSSAASSRGAKASAERAGDTMPPVLGEMHVRRGRYIGVAPLPGGLTNACLVKPSRPGDPDLHDPTALLLRELAHDPLLADRFERARLVAPPTVLGPLGVDVQPARIEGLLLAGDAAGFIDPMTGDGLRFAIRGGELAADAALAALAHGWSGVHAGLEGRRRDEFGPKWRFNRLVRAIVASPNAVALSATLAPLAPGVLRHVIARAGDCDLAEALG